MLDLRAPLRTWSLAGLVSVCERWSARKVCDAGGCLLDQSPPEYLRVLLDDRSCEHGGSFIDPCGLGTLMPEEETESPEEVRSQRRRSLPNVDE